MMHNGRSDRLFLYPPPTNNNNMAESHRNWYRCDRTLCDSFSRRHDIACRWLFHDPLHFSTSHRSFCCVIIVHNLTAVKRDGWNASRVRLSHPRPTQNTPPITVMK